MNTVDITPIFFDLIKNIVLLEYREIVKCDTFNELVTYVDEESEFMLSLKNDTLYFEDINDLIYGSRRYFELHEMKEEFWWLDQAIRKIETSVAMGELSSLFEDFKV
jgi:hemerythrin-like domain-containing protein